MRKESRSTQKLSVVLPLTLSGSLSLSLPACFASCLTHHSSSSVLARVRKGKSKRLKTYNHQRLLSESITNIQHTFCFAIPSYSQPGPSHHRSSSPAIATSLPPLPPLAARSHHLHVVLYLARHLLRSGYDFLNRLSGPAEVPVWKLKFKLG